MSAATPIVSPTPENLARAGDILRAGGLVAFPTETVYGLGGNALDGSAVARIFAAKGRPATNPVIVHVASIEDMTPLVDRIPQHAKMLAKRFWPGPLTLVLPKKPLVIHDIVTVGGGTVAVRVPNHPVALELLRVAGVPLAAPSANLSTQLSPTRAEHVLRGLDGLIDLIIDGGPTTGGIESTVVDVCQRKPRLLRHGLITVPMLEAVIGPIRIGPQSDASLPARSPGLQKKHYAPRTPLELASDSGWSLVKRHLDSGRRVGWLTFGPANLVAPPGVEIIEMPTEPRSFAARLYDALHVLDATDVDVLVISQVPVGDDWTAVHDRLSRAGRIPVS